MADILVVEDEPDIALGLQLDLRDEGYDVEIASNGEEASRRGREARWDLILLDVMLPLKDGFEVCRDLRRAKVRTPILMLTAKAQEAEKVMGLDMGADDYVTKPFSPRELRARDPGAAAAHAAGRARRRPPRSATAKWISPGRKCGAAAHAADLTAIELKMLEAFLRQPGRVHDPRADHRRGLGRHLGHRSRRRHAHRQAAAADRADPGRAATHRERRGIGYRFEP